jgi:peptidoglycan/xylan/chitin deacetylase (PgdA/CDA1 family)
MRKKFILLAALLASATVAGVNLLPVGVASAAPTVLVMDLSGLTNFALGKTVTSSTQMNNPGAINDNQFTNADAHTGNGANLQWVQFDLGSAQTIQAIKLWHYFGDGRVYKDVIVQLSNDKNFKTGVSTVFNNDLDGSAGRGVGKDSEYAEGPQGKLVILQPTQARFVRLYSNGSYFNEYNHYVEVQIWGGKKATDSQVQTIIPAQGNVALGAKVSSRASMQNPLYATDGIIAADKLTTFGSGPQYIQLDLGSNHSISAIKLWRNFQDGRTYRDLVIQLSGDENFELTSKIIFNNDSNNSLGFGVGSDIEYAETQAGAIINTPAQKGRYIRIWSNGSSVDQENHVSEIMVLGEKLVEDGYFVDNLALGKSITSSSKMSSAAYAVDGRANKPQNFTLLETPGLQSLTVDLGQTAKLYKIKLWHSYAEGLTYRDVIVQISDSADFSRNVRTVFNNDTDNSAGKGVGVDQPYKETAVGKEITFPETQARYVRFWSSGNNINNFNHYVEVQVYGTRPEGSLGKGSVQVPVLMYHSVDDSIPGIYSFKAAAFDQQMKFLKDAGYTALSFQKYRDIITGKASAPEKPVLITFDDGFLNNYTIAMPILQKYDFPATFFIISNLIGAENRVSAAQIKEMHAKGFDIGNHALNHEFLPDYSYDQQYAILKEAKQKLEAAVGDKIYSFGIPYGALNTDTIGVLDRLDYEMAFSSYDGVSSNLDNPLTIRRLFISGDYSFEQFKNIVEQR